MRDPTLRPMHRRPGGIETFRVEGLLEGEPVNAEWDGRWVVASTNLLVYADLALAVDDAFGETAIGAWLDEGVVTGGPEQLMLALVTSCDAIDVAEYDLWGCRRTITA